MEFINNPDINWSAVSAITNILVVIATFSTIIVTVWLSLRSTTPKGKIVIGSTDKTHFHFINVGVINITVMVMSVSLKAVKKGQRGKGSLFVKTIEKTLLPTENYVYRINNREISAKLVEKGYDIGDEVALYINFIDSYRRIHKKKFKFKVVNPEIVSDVRINKKN